MLRVDPHQINPAVETVHGPHLAVYDPQVASRHRLLLFLVGTGAKAGNSLDMDSAFAGWGYHAVSLDYENNVLSASLSHNRDGAAFEHYRQAIVTGAPVSEAIKVDSANSILSRVRDLLNYLVRNDPNGNWSEFVADGEPLWSRIVVAGHSQGSGHAAYIAKLYNVDRVLMFSGPQDYMTDLDRPAPWLSSESATPSSRFFAFLNQQDPFNVKHQIANCAALMGVAAPDTLMVTPGEHIDGEHHILINDFPAPQHHGTTLFPQFENVWNYMITMNIR